MNNRLNKPKCDIKMKFKLLLILTCIVALNIDAWAQLEGTISPDTPPRILGLQLPDLTGSQIGWEIILNIAEPHVVDLDFEIYSGNPKGKFMDPICTSEGAGSTESCRVRKEKLPEKIAWIKIFPVAGMGTTFYKISSTPLIQTADGKVHVLVVQPQIESIANVEVLQDTVGLYQVRITFADSLSDDLLQKKEDYSLKDKLTELEVNLPPPKLWGSRPGRGVRFDGVDISFKKEYVIKFKDDKAKIDIEVNIERSSFIESEDQKSFEEFEGAKILQPWQVSVVPKIVQGDSTINELGDIGLDWFFSRKIAKWFEYSFEGSFTLNKDDPANHSKLNLTWHSPLLLPVRKFGIRPLSLSVQNNATQASRFTDVSFSAATTIVMWPLEGSQPISVTLGLDKALRLDLDGKNYDDPRLNVQAHWSLIGFLGKGSEFFAKWQLWHRFDNLGNPRINPDERINRQYFEFKFVLPVMYGKNLIIKYADGAFAPTFVKKTSVQIGMEFFTVE